MEVLSLEEIDEKSTQPFYSARIAKLRGLIKKQEEKATKHKFYIQNYFVECLSVPCAQCRIQICQCRHERCIYPRRSKHQMDACFRCFYDLMIAKNIAHLQINSSELFCKNCFIPAPCSHN